MENKSNVTVIDACGQMCPRPLIMTKKVFDSLPVNGSMITLCDNRVAAGNIETFIRESGGDAVINGNNRLFEVYITRQGSGAASLKSNSKGGDAQECSAQNMSPEVSASQNRSAPETAEGQNEPLEHALPVEAARQNWGVLLTSDKLGAANPDLGELLMKSFLSTLGEAGPLPDFILFVNDGVKLAVSDNNALTDRLKELERDGVVLLSCGTCLEYLELQDRLKVGRITNMFEIVNRLSGPCKIVKL